MQILSTRLKHIILASLSLGLSLVFFETNYSKFIFSDVSVENYLDRSLLTSNASSELVEKLSTPAANSSETTSTFSQTHSIWKSLGSKFQLDHKADSAPVQAQIRALMADKENFYKILKASEPYIYFIDKEVEARKLPAEIALIPVIESEFNPYDHSNKGASGLWQLMPQTARDLGVEVRGNYDGRRNVVSSTDAALAYFNDLQRLFKGNWYLALAAYNSGEVKVLHAQKRAGTQNFWNLPLPHETKVYVPKLLAVAEIIQNPEKYGIHLPAVYNTPYFTKATILKSINLATIAEETGTDSDLLETLNPDYKKGNPPRNGSTILLPNENLSEIRSRLGEYIQLA